MLLHPFWLALLVGRVNGHPTIWSNILIVSLCTIIAPFIMHMLTHDGFAKLNNHH